MTQKTHYVLCTAVSPDGQATVGITKRKGPAFLLNKLTFPGGKVEPGETPIQAAARELKEETGIVVETSQLVEVDVVERSDALMHFFVAVTPAARYPQQFEQEPVWVLDTDFHYKQAAQQPQAYAPDFLHNLGLVQAVALAADLYDDGR